MFKTILDRITKNKIIMGVLITLFVLVGFPYMFQLLTGENLYKLVVGSPSQILPNVGCKLNGSASTSITYMASGTATTTLTCDLYTTASSGNLNLAADIVDLNIQLTASRTATILMVNTEHSMDGVDWYENSLDPNQIELATQNPIDISTQLSWTWTYASSSFPGQDAPASTTNRGHKVIRVPNSSRYIRAIFTMKGGNGAVWAEFLPKREVNN